MTRVFTDSMTASPMKAHAMAKAVYAKMPKRMVTLWPFSTHLVYEAVLCSYLRM